MPRNSPPASNQDYGDNVSPPPQVTGGGSSLTVKDEGVTLSTAVTSIDFVGAGVTATGTTSVTVTIPSGGSSNRNYAVWIGF